MKHQSNIKKRKWVFNALIRGRGSTVRLKTLADKMHVEICDDSPLILLYYWTKSNFCRPRRFSKPLLQPLEEGSATPAPEAGDACEQNPHELNPVTAPVPVYLSNQPVDRRNESPVWHSLRSLYNFRPHFPQRPLNLTAIWRFAAITVHSWVKINLRDSSLGQGFEGTLDFVLVTITYCDSSICRWYPSYNLHREYGQAIQYQPVEIQGWGKNRNSTTWRPSDQK